MKSGKASTDFQEIIDRLMLQLEGKEHMIQHLLDRVDALEKTIDSQSKSIEKMADEIATYTRMLFGTSSEKNHKKTNSSDGNNDIDSGEDNTRDDDSADNGSSNDKGSGKKHYVHPHKRNYDNIDEDKIVELKPNADEIKGAKLFKVTSTYRFYYVPGKICKIRYDRYIYAKDGALIAPKLPYVPEELEKRHADPALIASVLVNKYMYHLPIERQLAMINSNDIKIAKSTLHDWVTAGINALDGVYESIKASVLSDERVHIDETTMPVVDSNIHATRKGYDWGFVSPTYKMMFFSRMNGSRGNEALDTQMKDFKGMYIQTDGYGAYVNISERLGRKIIHIPCLAHVRRKFIESLQYHREMASEALSIIDTIFENERTYKERGLSPEQIEANREIELRPLLDKLKSWLLARIQAKDYYEDSNLGKAIHYAMDRVDMFYEVIKNGVLDISNNLAERTMRSHAMGRNNYLFCQNERSALRTCKIYSIIESCKLCKIDPYKYLVKVLSSEPTLGQTWDSMMPCNIAL